MFQVEATYIFMAITVIAIAIIWLFHHKNQSSSDREKLHILDVKLYLLVENGLCLTSIT